MRHRVQCPRVLRARGGRLSDRLSANSPDQYPNKLDGGLGGLPHLENLVQLLVERDGAPAWQFLSCPLCPRSSYPAIDRRGDLQADLQGVASNHIVE